MICRSFVDIYRDKIFEELECLDYVYYASIHIHIQSAFRNSNKTLRTLRIFLNKKLFYQ